MPKFMSYIISLGLLAIVVSNHLFIACDNEKGPIYITPCPCDTTPYRDCDCDETDPIKHPCNSFDATIYNDDLCDLRQRSIPIRLPLRYHTIPRLLVRHPRSVLLLPVRHLGVPRLLLRLVATQLRLQHNGIRRPRLPLRFARPCLSVRYHAIPRLRLRPLRPQLQLPMRCVALQR